ncbi:aminotransferase class I/II-fold pyridoxal phosphate-dependent enzyme, partial [Methylosinus sp. R-45379]|uniref:aminotransferase class I/II-fold pyridoxal phosphate-dependent enzyme n=1 Tax=Methylosinus sp. R-45379 TaxID=980563 RepID=UPI000A656E19
MRDAMALCAAPPAAANVYMQMRALAERYGAIDLASGVLEDIGPSDMFAAAREAIATGNNQYSPPEGLADLRRAIGDHACAFPVGDPLEQATVFCGATEALFAFLLTFLAPGDEIIGFEPAYDYYPEMCQIARVVW